MVGTIEPRKCHELALDAMEILWTRGSDICLVLVGKKGWLVDKLWRRINQHPLLSKKLYLFEAASDSELSYLYQNAKGLLMLSRGEGFGLPLIEAAKFGTPILCSDLPVFREVCGDNAYYANTFNPKELSLLITSWIVRTAAEKTKNIVDSSKISYLSWSQSADNLLNVILGAKWL